MPDPNEDLVISNLRLVGFVMRRLASIPLNWIDDARQDGYLALIGAARDYDPERGKFSTFAVWRIWGSMKRFGMSARFRPPRYREMAPLISEYVPSRRTGPAREVENKCDVEVMLSWVDDRRAEILRRHYGIGMPPQDQGAIARQMGISRQRVSYMEVETIDYLRRTVREREEERMTA